MDIYFHGTWRMDWGFGNPNVTAAFIGTIAVGIWLFSYVFKRGFWLSLALFIPLEICLLHTMSRGGVLGTLAGLAILVSFSARPWPKMRVAGVLLAIWIAVVGAIFLGADQRLSQGLVHEDLSISNRLAIWKFAPDMLFDAPSGFGWGNSGKAFMDWYQPLERHELYGSLASTHLSKIVELGLVGAFFYIFAWLAALIICSPDGINRWRSVPFAILVAFGVAASFTNLVPRPMVWIIPGLAVIACLFDRVRRAAWPKLSVWTNAILVSALVVCALFAVGAAHLTAGPKLQFKNGSVILGAGDPEIIIVGDVKAMGRDFPKTLRSYISPDRKLERTIIVMESLKNVGNVDGKTVVLAGDCMRGEENLAAEVLARAEKIILLSPTTSPQEVNARIERKQDVHTFFGEFSQLPSSKAWDEFSLVHQLEGVGDFLPNWPTLVVGQRK